MSTKIYDGLRVTNPLTFLTDLEEYREKLCKNYNRYSVIMHFIKYWLESESFFESVQIKTNASHALREYKSIFDNQEKELSDNIHFGYYDKLNLGLRYFPKAQLAIPYGFDGDQMNQLLKFNSIKEYGYWNSTDKPNNIIDKEWAERELIWDSVTRIDQYQYGIGYTKEIKIELYKEVIDCVEMITAIRKDPRDYLKKYLRQEIKDHSIQLFGSPEQKEQLIKWNEERTADNIVSTWVKTEKINRVIYHQNHTGETYFNQVFPIYLAELKKHI